MIFTLIFRSTTLWKIIDDNPGDRFCIRLRAIIEPVTPNREEKLIRIRLSDFEVEYIRDLSSDERLKEACQYVLDIGNAATVLESIPDPE